MIKSESTKFLSSMKHLSFLRRHANIVFCLLLCLVYQRAESKELFENNSLDTCMVANLMYYRTYFSAIPLSSYMLAGNLADFLPSVTASLRWCDLLFPISTVVTVFLTFRIGCRQKITLRFSRRTYFVLLIFSCALLSINLSVRGGFIAIYRALRSSAHQHASGPPLYTCLLYTSPSPRD